jgi:hypothetical protein
VDGNLHLAATAARHRRSGRGRVFRGARAIGCAAAALLIGTALAATAATSDALAQPGAQPADRDARQPSTGSTVQALRQWVLGSGDGGEAAFAIADKRAARLWVFDARGRPLGDAPVLLGLARGDSSVPGIGERAMSEIRPHERTTPAGRFVAEPGRNAKGEDIIWIDYDAAVSMHRLRQVSASERRAQRLASPSADDNRITYGCINVPADFYDRRLRPALARGAVVYVLPDTLPVRSVFASLRL